MVSITRILCPVDFSECSKRALDHAVAIGRWFGAGIEVLHVAPEPVVAGRAEMQTRLDALRTEAYAEAVAQAKQFVDSAGVSDLRVQVSVERGDPSALIVSRAPVDGAGPVIMGTHGRTGFERLVLGSVAEKVLRRAACPVLTVPPRAAERPAETMFQRVLCPVDFSPSSESALEFALSLTARTGGSLMSSTRSKRWRMSHWNSAGSPHQSCANSCTRRPRSTCGPRWRRKRMMGQRPRFSW
jgi:nucleotide-binding universal stress UspA family protein